MHTPTPDIDPDDNDTDDDTPKPPVPPDQQPDIVPVEEPPRPGRGKDAPPMIAVGNMTA